MAKVSYAGLFPMCIIPTSDSSLVGIGTQYPAGYSLPDAMTFFWKAKEFHITGNISTKYKDPDGVFHDKTYEIDDRYTFNPELGYVPSTERDYVCIGLAKPLLFDSGDSGSNTISYSGPWMNYGNTPPSTVPSPVLGYNIGNLYYLCKWYTLVTNDNGTFLSNTAPSGDIYYVSLIINGNTYQIPVRANGGSITVDGIENCVFDSINSLSLTMVISEQWPYNP